jgi:hypothetical protein
LPILLVAKHQDTEAGTAVGVSDWLIKPFTTAHVRTKVRTGLLRNACNKTEELVRVLEKASAEQPSISSEKADLLWMYGRKIAAFDTPAFNNQLGRIIAEAPRTVVRKAS